MPPQSVTAPGAALLVEEPGRGGIAISTRGERILALSVVVRLLGLPVLLL